jgi:RHS repeat-associated protein
VETAFHWLDNVILSEAGEGSQRDYLFLPTTFFCIAVNDSRFGRAFLCPDRTGSPVCMISFDGTILWRRDSRLLGSAPEGRDTGRLTSPIGFLGQYREPSSGLDYNWARFYDATTGRYLTPDPIGLSAGTNLYAYAADPLVGVDPYGLFVVNLGAPPMWCKWNRQQRKEYRDKVNRYNTYIAALETSPGQGIQVTACARTGSKASQQWASSKCCNRKPPKQKKPKGSGGSSADCAKDIDHIIDCQLGGPQTCPAVCNNLIPVNKSVNSSFGPTLESKLTGMNGQFLTQVTFSPTRCKVAKPRTPSCV